MLWNILLVKYKILNLRLPFNLSSNKTNVTPNCTTHVLGLTLHGGQVIIKPNYSVYHSILELRPWCLNMCWEDTYVGLYKWRMMRGGLMSLQSVVAESSLREIYSRVNWFSMISLSLWVRVHYIVYSSISLILYEIQKNWNHFIRVWIS